MQRSTRSAARSRQIDFFGKAAAKLAKLDADVQDACNQPGIDLAALFDGLPASCHGTPAALADCLVNADPLPGLFRPELCRLAVDELRYF